MPIHPQLYSISYSRVHLTDLSRNSTVLAMWSGVSITAVRVTRMEETSLQILRATSSPAARFREQAISIHPVISPLRHLQLQAAMPLLLNTMRLEISYGPKHSG